MGVSGFIVVAVLWTAFAGAVVFSQASIHDTWTWFMNQSILVKISIGMLFLPWVAGMWVWESSWPVAARGALVGGIAWANVYAFSPWKSG